MNEISFIIRQHSYYFILAEKRRFEKKSLFSITQVHFLLFGTY